MLICCQLGNGFDWPYLFKRADFEHCKVRNFKMLGRTLKTSANWRQSENKGFKKCTVTIPGRINFDLMRYSQDTNQQAKSHSLDALAEEAFGDHKMVIILKWISLSLSIIGI